MYIKNDMSFNDLMNNCWSGAIDTLNTIEKHGKEDELMAHLEEYFFDEVPTMTQINDYLWFEDENIFRNLDISNFEELEDEENIDFSEYADFNSFCSGRDCCTCPFFRYVSESDYNFDCEKYFNEKYN